MVSWCGRHCVSAACTAVCGQLVQQALCQCSVYCCMRPVGAANLLCQFRVYCCKWRAGAAGIMSVQCVLLYVVSCCSRPVSVEPFGSRVLASRLNFPPFRSLFHAVVSRLGTLERWGGWEGQSEVSCCVPFVCKDTLVNYTVWGSSSISLYLRGRPAARVHYTRLVFVTKTQAGVRECFWGKVLFYFLCPFSFLKHYSSFVFPGARLGLPSMGAGTGMDLP